MPVELFAVYLYVVTFCALSPWSDDCPSIYAFSAAFKEKKKKEL